MNYLELVDALDRDRRERGLFHDLMRYRVREILLVGSLYDSFVVESDGFLTEQIYGEYFRLNLSTIPRVTSAYTDESALARFSSGECDLVIIMAGLDFERPLRLAMEMKGRLAAIPVLLLVLNNSSLAELDMTRPELAFVDRVFVWNGYSKLLVGMIKYVEDRGNVDADIASGMVRVILLIEDSVRYYSRYLPLLYTVVLKQTQALIEEERGVETYRLLRSRARPKILLAASYEEAEKLFLRYEDAILAVITDLRFQHRGKMDPEAGFSFVGMARQRKPGLPVMIQSSEVAVRSRAEALGAAFADKSSESLALELGDFLRSGLGFGPFRFFDEGMQVIAVASTIEEFMVRVGEVPADCLVRHAAKNQFSTWLAARGEYRFAGLLRHYSIEDFATPEELRAFILRVLNLVRREKSEGLVPDFDESTFRDALSMTRLASGSVGGKGRGLEFLKRVVESDQLERDFPDIAIRVPRTLFIGIDAFEDFLERNGLWAFAYYQSEAGEVLDRFRSAAFAPGFKERAARFLSACDRPLILRSSGLLEDMVMLPFAGVYESCFLPNTAEDAAERLEAFLDGLRTVWASLFTRRARSHFEAVGYSLEEERMAVVVQELVGHREGARFQPRFSGIAYSALEGFGGTTVGGGSVVVFARGFGSELTEGGQAVLASLEASGMSQGRQVFQRSLPLEDGAPTLLGEGLERRIHHPATPGGGPELLPGAVTRAMKRILELVSRSYGNSVVLEFAYDAATRAEPPSLYLLQARPYKRRVAEAVQALPSGVGASIVRGEIFGLEGELLLEDILLVSAPMDEGSFSPAAAEGLARAVRELDRRIAETGRGYILVGAESWCEAGGIKDLPLEYADIAHASLFVELSEAGREGIPPLGSHFFFNLIAAGSAWFRAELEPGAAGISWETHAKRAGLSENGSCIWLRASAPLLLRASRGRAELLRNP
jgi:hypothetical protein